MGTSTLGVIKGSRAANWYPRCHSGVVEMRTGTSLRVWTDVRTT